MDPTAVFKQGVPINEDTEEVVCYAKGYFPLKDAHSGSVVSVTWYTNTPTHEDAHIPPELRSGPVLHKREVNAAWKAEYNDHVTGGPQLGLMILKDIKAGKEILVDYNAKLT